MARLIPFEDAKIKYRNFSGKEKNFNPAGRRNFCLIIDEETAAKMTEDGFKVKVTPPRNEGDEPEYYIQVKVNYDNNPPQIYMIANGKKTLLTEKTVGSLDYAEIERIDLKISPYRYDFNGRTGLTAYCDKMYVTIQPDPIDARYDFDDSEDEEIPFY